MTVLSKICGISTPEAARTAINHGADLLGFIHFAKSPRHLSLSAMGEVMQAIRQFSEGASAVPLVSVVVDPSDEVLQTLAREVRPDLIQLHGKETPRRVAQIRSDFGLPVIKAISVETVDDLKAADAYDAADYLLFDAKTPRDAALPGGMGLSFDWGLMRDWAGGRPWLLAGGLDAGNVAHAVHLSGAPGVDVSSGVESAPGIKDPDLISGFLKAVKSL